MPEGIMIGSECADWWDQQLREYHVELEQYVLENPSFFGVMVATTKATAADFAHAYFVDLARLGEGAAEGGVKGIVQDLLRLLNFIPPGKILPPGTKTFLGKVAQMVSNVFHWRSVQGGLCAPIAIAQALQRTGQKFAVSLAEVASAIGQPLKEIFEQGVREWTSIGPALGRLGVEFTQIPALFSGRFDELARMAETLDGPLMVRLKAFTKKGNTFVEEGHAILVGKTREGVRIIDRSGTYRNLEELSKNYDIIGVWELDTRNVMYRFQNAIIDDSLRHLLNQHGIFAILVRQSLGVFDFNRTKTSPEFVKRDFTEFVARKRANRPPVAIDEILITGGESVTVIKGHSDFGTLSGIAKKIYKNWELWPLIWKLNEIPNPNRLNDGQKVLVLPLERYTAAEITEAKRLAPTWKNYPL